MREATSNPLVIGHRGAKGYEPENTILSFQKALDLGVPWVEFDVWNVEGTPVVIHDHRVERLTNGVGYLPDLTLSYLRSLDAGKGQQVPLLREVLDLLVGKIGINIELKGVGTAKTVVAILSEYIRTKKLDLTQVLVSSFNHRELLEAKRLLPELKIGALICGIPLDLARMTSELGAYSVNQSFEFVSDNFVSEAHASGLKVYVYTVNHDDDVRRMIKMGVDGLFSDFPDRAMGIVKGE